MHKRDDTNSGVTINQLGTQSTLVRVGNAAGDKTTGCVPIHHHCAFCGWLLPDDPGQYYHLKTCEANFYRDLLKTETNPHMRCRYEKKLEMALYVGD